MQNILVRQPSDLTIDWAQRVVNKHHSHIVVSNVDVVSVDIGTTTRIRVNVEHNEPSILPGQWFVKLPSMAWQARLITALPRLLHTEVRFYNEVARIGISHHTPFPGGTKPAWQGRDTGSYRSDRIWRYTW